MDTLGYGALDNQFGSIYNSAISINSTQVIPENSIGVIEIFLENTPLGVKEADREVEFELFPNPTSESLSLNFTSETREDLAIQIFTTSGIEVFNTKTSEEAGENTINIDTQELQTGVHIVNMRFGNRLISRKVVIHRK